MKVDGQGGEPEKKSGYNFARKNLYTRRTKLYEFLIGLCQKQKGATFFEQLRREKMMPVMKLEQALKALPGIKRVKAKQLFHTWKWELMEMLLQNEEKSPSLVVGDMQINLHDIGEIFGEERFTSATISPRGAKILVALYERNLLPVNGSIESVDPVLSQYALLNQTFAEIQVQEQASRDAERQKRENKFNDLASIDESDFSFSFLNALFFHHGKKGIGVFQLEVGGILVTKQVTRYKSNSRLSSSCSVSFTGKKKDGTEFKFESPSLYQNNRANDPIRNWGLPE